MNTDHYAWKNLKVNCKDLIIHVSEFSGTIAIWMSKQKQGIICFFEFLEI